MDFLWQDLPLYSAVNHNHTTLHPFIWTSLCEYLSCACAVAESVEEHHHQVIREHQRRFSHFWCWAGLLLSWVSDDSMKRSVETHQHRETAVSTHRLFFIFYNFIKWNRSTSWKLENSHCACVRACVMNQWPACRSFLYLLYVYWLHAISFFYHRNIHLVCEYINVHV